MQQGILNGKGLIHEKGHTIARYCLEQPLSILDMDKILHNIYHILLLPHIMSLIVILNLKVVPKFSKEKTLH